MKKKKGFTLIELLAVIIILAVIALIATPIVLRVIENSRKESNKNSTYGILDAAKLYYTESMLDTSKVGVDGRTNLLDVVSITGKRPDSGTLYISNSGLTAIAVVYDDYCFKKEFNEQDLTETTQANCSVTAQSNAVTPTFGGTFVAAQEGETHKGIVYIDPSNIETECTPSITLTTANVGCKKFYIFNDSGDTYKMIMDRNTTALVAWNSDEENSNSVMKEVATALATDTAGWIGNPRLITADEVARTIGSTIWNSATATQTSGMYFGSKGSANYSEQSEEHQEIQRSYHWLFDYTEDCTTYGCSEADSSAKGYWTSTPLANDEYYVWMVHRYGFLNNSDASNDDLFGVRPVITLSKSQLQ